MNRKIVISSTAIITVLALGILIGMVVADTEDSATATFGLNASPVVSDVQFVDASYALASTLTPDDSTVFGVNTTILHSSNIDWIKNITWYLFDDSVYGSNWFTADPDGVQLTAITWTESTDTWSVDQGALTQWNIVSPIDPGTAYASTSYDFVCRFAISKAARYDTDWNCTVIAFDDDVGTPENDSSAETGLVTMNAHYEASFSSANFTWGADVQPSSTNNTHNTLTVQIYANADWELRLNASDFLPSNIDIEAQNILIWDDDGVAGGVSLYVRNTIQTCTGTWDAQSPMTDEVGFSRDCDIFLSPGAYFSSGIIYNTTVYVWIQGDT